MFDIGINVKVFTLTCRHRATHMEHQHQSMHFFNNKTTADHVSSF